MNCQTSIHLLGIKNTLLSHENNICTFMRCGNLTYDTCIWLKITSLSSTASPTILWIFGTLSVGGCGGHGCYFQPNPCVIKQISASNKCTDIIFMT